MARIPWTFEDVHDAQTYELEINPAEATMPAVSKTYTPQPSAAGGQIIFQGRSPAQQMSLNGTLLTEDQYNALRTWVRKEKQIRLTDDLGRVYWVYLKSFSPNRVRDTQYPWRHEFSITAVVLSWED